MPIPCPNVLGPSPAPVYLTTLNPASGLALTCASSVPSLLVTVVPAFQFQATELPTGVTYVVLALVVLDCKTLSNPLTLSIS